MGVQENKIDVKVSKSKKDIETKIEMKVDNVQLRNLENELKFLEEEKSRKLALIEKVKMFNKQMAGDGPKPRKFRVVDGLAIEVKVAKESKPETVKTTRRRKSHANPLVKSLHKPKMSKIRSVN